GDAVGPDPPAPAGTARDAAHAGRLRPARRGHAGGGPPLRPDELAGRLRPAALLRRDRGAEELAVEPRAAHGAARAGLVGASGRGDGALAGARVDPARRPVPGRP